VALNRRLTFALATAGVFGAGIGGAVLVSAATDGTITGCVNGLNNQGTLRITGDPTGFTGPVCNSFEHAITFNTAGVAGPAGPAGPRGATGPTGVAGAPGAGGGTSTTGGASAAPTNFIGTTSFDLPSHHYAEAKIDCPKGDVAEGGTATMVSPLGSSATVGNADAGPGVTSPNGHTAVGWTGDATNGTGSAASLKLSVICAGPNLNAAAVSKKLVLLRRLHKTKTS
jgi:hypothetical protein